MRRFAMVSVALAVSLLLSGCGEPGGMMGRRGRMSGRGMMEMMREPGMMDEWMGEMMEDPELMARMMTMMQRRLRRRGREGMRMPLYCPMMGFTPQNPPSPEPPYEPGSLTDAELFRRKCSGCHALPDPGLHSPVEWGETVERMAAYIDEAGFVSADAAELEAILGYLESAAAAGGTEGGR